MFHSLLQPSTKKSAPFSKSLSTTLLLYAETNILRFSSVYPSLEEFQKPLSLFSTISLPGIVRKKSECTKLSGW